MRIAKEAKKVLFIVLFVFLCITTSQSQQIRKLPDPPDPVNAPNPYGLTPTPSDYSNPLEVPSSSVARAVAERAVSGLDTTTRQIQETQTMIQGLQQQKRKLDEDINQLWREKQQVLAELKVGFYCRCMKSKTEIEKCGENFYEHLRRNSAKVEIGMKAADLWLNKLDDVFEAARILTAISKQSANPAIVQQVQSLIDISFRRLFHEYLEQKKNVGTVIWQQKYDAAFRLVNKFFAVKILKDSPVKQGRHR